MIKKTGKFTVIMVFMIFVATVAFGQISPQIVSGLKAGDSKTVAGFFNENVEMVVLDRENVCSQAQGEQILKDFFSKNKPTDFKITHQGGSDAPYAIGKMQTSTASFRIYFLMKSIGGSYKIVQLRIEKD